MIWLVLVVLVAIYILGIWLLKHYGMYSFEGWPINLGPLWVVLGGIVIAVVLATAIFAPPIVIN